MSHHRKATAPMGLGVLAVATLGLLGAAQSANAHGYHDPYRGPVVVDRYNRGDVIDHRLDRRARQAWRNGNYGRALRLDAAGNRIDARWDARRGRYYVYRYDCGRRVRVWL